jgi:hypothetical protein
MSNRLLSLSCEINSPGALCGTSGAGETIASNNCGRALEAQLWRFLGKDAHDRVSHGGGVLR